MAFAIGHLTWLIRTLVKLAAGPQDVGRRANPQRDDQQTAAKRDEPASVGPREAAFRLFRVDHAGSCHRGFSHSKARHCQLLDHRTAERLKLKDS